jgi:sodium/potassium-transporting ATPase subunit alpha
MVTGDAAATAQAIAEQVGILSGNIQPHYFSTDFVENQDIEVGAVYGRLVHGIVVVGNDLVTITAEGWDFIYSHSEMVFARTTPEQKLQIVKQGQLRGHIVGVTGDGVNDSPALKAADVGIAMNSGSDVAKDAASIVLLNDNFEAIVHGMEEGRLIFANLRKVIGYQIAAGCWSEVLPVLATFFFGIPQPLSSFLMIIISCMTDVYAGVALTHEAPETSLMLDKPRNPKKTPLVSAALVMYAYLFYGTLQSVGSFFVYFLYMSERGPHSAPNPIPADDDGTRVFPAGYLPLQLIGAWNFGLNAGNLGADEAAAATVASSCFFVALITAQWGHLISIRRKTPYFYDSIMNTTGAAASFPIRFLREVMTSPPKLSIVAAIILSALTVNFFNEVPTVQVSCGTGSVPARYW